MDWRSLVNSVFGEEPKGQREVSGKVEDAPKPKVDYFDKLAFVESSNNPKAKAKHSSAAGLYQFTEGTWNEYTKKMGVDYSLDDRFDPKKAREVVEFKTKDIVNRLKPVLGRDLNDTEKYLGHFLGITGARRMLAASPSARVDSVISKDALAANKTIFLNKDGKPKTLLEVYDHFKEKFQ